MRSVSIYVEGGRDTAQQRAELRTGFDRLLAKQKEAARTRGLGWKLVPCGSRMSAYQAFMNARKTNDGRALIVLLVDSEETLPGEVSPGDGESLDEAKRRETQDAQARKDHLNRRDHWDLKEVEADQIHLLVTCMEAWLAADPDALAMYYGQGFRSNKLPKRLNLEEEPKNSLYSKLADATKETSKRSYSEAENAKIKHASKLLARLDPQKVATRCPRFKTFTAWLDRRIREAELR